MSDKLYLSRFRCQNFRAFGDVDLTVPEGPGVVLLEGPNGLGKTSWMEALEWVLSGRVHRWQRQDEEHGLDMARHVRRRGIAAGEPCRVELEFGRQGVARSEGQEPEPAIWLCDDPARWSLRPENLNGFLRGTHLLPQSPSLRLLHLDAEDRWNQVLRIVSGYSEIDDLSGALQGSKKPLTAEIKDREARVTQARTNLETWKARVAAVLDRRARTEAAAPLVAPSRVAELIAAEDVPASHPVDSEAGAREMTAHLGGILAARRNEKTQLEQRRATLAVLADVPPRWLTAAEASKLADAAVEAREGDETRLRGVLFQRHGKEQSAGLALSEAEGRVTDARRHTEALGLLGETLAALPEAYRALTAARDGAALAKTDLEKATSRRDEARRDAELRRSYEVRTAAYQRRQVAHEAALGSWRRIQDLVPQRGAAATAVQALIPATNEANEALRTSRARLAECVAATERARTLAESVRAAAGEVQGLVAALARHLDDDSAECPLCLAPYGKGVLRERAEKAKERQGPAVVRSEEALRAAAEMEAEATAEVEGKAAVCLRAEREIEGRQAEIHALDREISELRARMVGIAMGREAEDLEHLRAALDGEAREIADLPGAVLESLSVLDVRLEKADDDATEAGTQHERALVPAEQSAATLAQMEARRSNLSQQLDVPDGADLAGLTADARASLGREEEALRLAREVLAAARAEREQVEIALKAAMAHTTSARAAQAQRKAEQQEIARSWTSHSLDLPPSGERLTEAVDGLVARLTALDGRIASMVATVEGIGRWREHAGLDRDARELDLASGGSGPDGWAEHTRRLQEELEAAERARARAEAVRNAVETMANRTTNMRESMRSELQARLTPILKPMLRSLIVDRNVAEAVIILAEERRKTIVRATVGKDATDLLALASEGQMSGVNLAVQLSMALAFQWCRWPAVLLDDPAQYSDVVHSTNLVETLRVLALHHGFQVFLATHERDFALYVERKFRNDGLPATRVMFRQPSDERGGVVPRLALLSREGY